MSKATNITFDRISRVDKQTRIFKIIDGGKKRIRELLVQDYKNGTATLIPNPGCYIDDFAEVVANSFLQDSNVPNEIMRKFQHNSPFYGVEFTFNDVYIKITKNNFEKEHIVACYRNVKAGQKKCME